ncbi:MAG: hypothetical protein GXX98_13530, partial [Planctomycetes bacterium]|nr:hypothetical protein [Planctomycetota bacterium]
MNARVCLPTRSICAMVVLWTCCVGRAQQAVPGPVIEPWRFQVGACTHFSQGKGILELNL